MSGPTARRSTSEQLMTTPQHKRYTTDWYVKWLASIVIIVAISLRSSGVSAFHIWDLMLSLLGCLLWLWVAVVWKDRALMLLNGSAAVVLFGGVLQYYFA